MSEQEHIEQLQAEILALKEEVDTYKALYEKEKQKKLDVEAKLAQAKETAKKGLDASKELFSVTKHVFGRAKETFKEEWDKTRTNEQPSAQQPTTTQEEPHKPDNQEK